MSMTQFSIARYYGSIKFNGDFYIYRPDVDELIRDDVLAWVIKRQKRKTPND